MKDYRRQARDEGLQRQLKYSSDDNDEGIEAEPRPPSNRQARPALRIGSPVIRRANRRTVGFEGISERAPNGIGRTIEEIRGDVSNRKTGNGGNAEVNLPLLLDAHLGRTKAGDPL
ncbi:hypothetical protein Tco_0686701 [Tanacetum coccineum]